MFDAIKNILSKPIVWIAGSVAAVGGLAYAFFKSNDFTPLDHPGQDSAVPSPAPPSGTTDPASLAAASMAPRDYSEALKKLDTSKPIGVLMFNVEPQYEDHLAIKDAERHIINAARNNFKEKMAQNYGDNVIVVEGASIEQLQDFSKQFNTELAGRNPEVHFVANHHQGGYDDQKLADFLGSVEAKSKRAMMMSCGPDSSCYDLSDFDYVILPRADGNIMGPDLSLKLGPAYIDAIEWMRNTSDPKVIEKKFAEETSSLDTLRDQVSNFSVRIFTRGEVDFDRLDADPAKVVVPSTGIPTMPDASVASSK